MPQWIESYRVPSAGRTHEGTCGVRQEVDAPQALFRGGLEDVARKACLMQRQCKG